MPAPLPRRNHWQARNRRRSIAPRRNLRKKAAVNPKWRNGLFVGGGVVLALVAGWQIAQESFLLVGAVGGLLLLWLASRALAVPVDALVAGLVLAGYLIGNRGFAQLSVPTLPLLPGELALGIGLLTAIWTAARAKTLAVRRDTLNFVLVVWLAVGGIRLWFDFRVHGFVALRDFALLYYALFFFLGQEWWNDPAKRRWLEGCLSVGFAVGAPVFLAFTRWPDFFLTHFSVQGVPLIYVKSDVQAGLLVAGSFWFLHRYVRSGRTPWLLLTILTFLGVTLANSRAALLALGVACLWPLACRHRALVRPLSALFAAGVLLLVTLPFLTQSPWQESLAYRFYETASSMVDFTGSRAYETMDLGDKPDNNRFRLTWWKAVIDETWEEGRWLGLGFGYDLAAQFTRVYYAAAAEEFSARSPHNFILTVFGRMGLVGTGLLLVFLAGMAVRTWRAGRLAARDEGTDAGFSTWIGAWGIFVSACFGVVLEGPMGAVIFWTLLGMANASLAQARAEADPAPADDGPHLRAGEPAAQVAAVS